MDHPSPKTPENSKKNKDIISLTNIHEDLELKELSETELIERKERAIQQNLKRKNRKDKYIPFEVIKQVERRKK